MQFGGQTAPFFFLHVDCLAVGQLQAADGLFQFGGQAGIGDNQCHLACNPAEQAYLVMAVLHAQTAATQSDHPNQLFAPSHRADNLQVQPHPPASQCALGQCGDVLCALQVLYGHISREFGQIALHRSALNVRQIQNAVLCLVEPDRDALSIQSLVQRLGDILEVLGQVGGLHHHLAILLGEAPVRQPFGVQGLLQE